MKNFVLYLLCISLTTYTYAQTKHTVAKADVTYQIKNMGFKTSGSFSGFKAAIVFDKDHLATSSIEASVDARTINSEDDMRDNHLKKEEYFDVEHYPAITMKSISFKAKNASNYTGQFNVTIKGKTKLVELPFTYIVNGSKAIFKGELKLNRLDFAIGDKSMVLSNEVVVSLNIETAL